MMNTTPYGGHRRRSVAPRLLLVGAALLTTACELDLIGAERDGEVRVEMAADESAVAAPPGGETSIETGSVTARYRVLGVRDDGSTVPVTSGFVESTVQFNQDFRSVAAAAVRPGPFAELLVEVSHVSALVEQGRVLGNPATGVFEVAIAENSVIVLAWQNPFDVSAATQRTLWIDLNAHEWLPYHVGRIVPAAAFEGAVRIGLD